MKKALLFFFIFAAALQAQPDKEKAPAKIEEMNIARKNIFWSVTLSLWNIDPGIPVTDIFPLSVDTESMKKIENILHTTPIAESSWLKFFFNYEVKNVVFAANFEIEGKLHEAVITHEAIYDLTDFGIYMPEGEQLAALTSFISTNKARLDSSSLRWNRLDQIVFTPDGTKLIAWCDSKPYGSIKIWSAKDGSLQKELPLKGEKEFVWALNLNNDGTKLAYVSVYPEDEVDSVSCYSLKEERLLWKKKLSDKGEAAFAVNFSAKTGDLIVVNYEGVHTYNSENGNESPVQKEIFNGFANMDARLNQNYAGVSPSGKYAAAWQTDAFKGYGGRFSGVTDFAYERDARYNKLRIWDLENNKEVNEINAAESGITENIYFTPDEKNCVFKIANNKIYQFPLNGKKTSALWNDTTFINKVYPVYMSFSPSGKYVAVANELTAQVWDLDNKVIVKDFNRVQKKREDIYKKSYPVVFSPDGKYMAMEYYGCLKLYDVNTFEPVWSVYSWPEDDARIWVSPAEYEEVQR